MTTVYQTVVPNGVILKNLNINSWKHAFLKIHKIRYVKLRWLQMRFLHRIIATNITLKKIDVVDDTLCYFCNNEKNSIEHIFF